MSKQNQSKQKQLWQIFFDDNQQPEAEMSSNRARQAGNSHGVLYRGLLEAESDSEQEVDQDTMPRQDNATPSGRSSEMITQKETVLFAKSASHSAANSIQNYNKPFNAKEWESVDISQNSTNDQQRTLLPSGGARYIIRSESDLELAIPASDRPRKCCCLPSKGSQSETFERYACIVLAFVAMSAVYVAIIIAIVYGFK